MVETGHQPDLIDPKRLIYLGKKINESGV